MSQFNRVVRYTKTVLEKDFYRRALIELASDDNTPEDILTMQFGKVTEHEKEFMSVTSNVSIDYTVSIGYDKYVKEYNRNTQKYEDKRVTTWEPFSGHAFSEESCIMPTGANYDPEDITAWGTYMFEEELSQAIKTAKEKSIKILKDDSMILNSECLALAESAMMSRCFRGVNLPGDRQKDERYTGMVDLKNICGARVGVYATEYTYGGAAYKIKSFTCGDVKMFDCEKPSVENDTSKLASKKVLPFTIIGLLFILGGLVGLIASWCADMDDLTVVGAVLGCFAAMIVGGIVLAAGSKKKKKAIKEANFLRKQAKLEKLMELLAKKNLPALTEREKALFNE